MTCAATEAGATIDMGLARTTWLAGLRVVCTTGSIPLRIASRVLAQMGAETAELFANDAYGAKADLWRYDVVLVDRIENIPIGRTSPPEPSRSPWISWPITTGLCGCQTALSGSPIRAHQPSEVS